jgi:hypothetical protein
MNSEANGGQIRHRIGAGGSFTLHTVSGTVRLSGTDGDEVVVVARSSGGSREGLELIVDRSEGALRIEPERRRRTGLGALWNEGDLPAIDFVVELPRGARVELNALSADVSGGELHGDQTYKLVSGDLELAGLGGRLDAKSVSGDIDLRASLPIEIDATTTSGDMEIEGQLEFLKLRSVSGDARVRGRLSIGPEHRVETVSGDLLLEPQGGLTIEASGPIVSLSSNLGGAVKSGPGQRGLVVGDGSARLRFRSMSGDVSVIGEPGANQPRPAPQDSLEILRALERGEIDVDEATERLSEVSGRA